MSCERFQTQLVDYLYGELDAAARQAFDAHLAECPDCAREAAALRGVLALVRQVPAPEPDPAVSQRILHAARAARAHAAHQRPQRGGLWRWLLQPAVTAAVLALVMISVGLIGVLDTGDEAPGAGQPAEKVQASASAPEPGPVAAEVTAVEEKAAELDEKPAAEPAARSLDEAERGLAPDFGASPRAAPADAASAAEPPPAPRSARASGRLRAADEFADAERTAARRHRRARRRPARDRGPAGKRAERGRYSAPAPAKSAEPEAPEERTGARAAAPARQGEKKREAARRQKAPPPLRDQVDADPLDGLVGADSDGGAESRAFAQPPPGHDAVDSAASTGGLDSAERRVQASRPAAPADDQPDGRTAARERRRPAEGIASLARPQEPEPPAGGEQPPAAQAEQAEQVEQAAAARAESEAPAARPAEPVQRTRAGRDQDAAAGADALYRSALEAQAAEDHTAAAAAWRAFLRAAAGDARATGARYALARALFAAGRCRQAIAAVDRALAAAPRHRLAADALFDQASCLVKLGRFEHARAVYQRIERDFPARHREAERERHRIE